MTQNKVEKKTTASGLFGRLFRHQLFIPIAALLLLVIFNLIMDPAFFAIRMEINNAGNNVLLGSLVTILDSGSELAILAIGMTLVTSACGGQDISVGANIAIAGSVMLRIICGEDARAEEVSVGIVIVAFLVAALVAMLFGAFNGLLVAHFNIQPMVATLILYTAGRHIAAWVNNNTLPKINDTSFGYIGGYIPGIPIPTPIFIAIACMALIALVLKFTALGLYTQAIGVNENSSRLNGINPKAIKILSFVILGLCVAVAAFIKVGRNTTINYSGVAKDIEMDAILAVALGGNALGGGRFNMGASILGAYVIQFLTTTLYACNVESSELPAYKAVVVIILVIMSAPVVRDKLKDVGKKLKSKKNVEVKEVG
ncbi:MAG: ABC transporter permease [Lachnospiraceae bacterium]|nr:ABC transporter permease [Lachnospiraceae bacterium]